MAAFLASSRRFSLAGPLIRSESRPRTLFRPRLFWRRFRWGLGWISMRGRRVLRRPKRPPTTAKHRLRERGKCEFKETRQKPDRDSACEAGDASRAQGEALFANPGGINSKHYSRVTQGCAKRCTLNCTQSLASRIPSEF